MGEVFDVTRGAQHYERAGGYNCFAGRDGSRCTLAHGIGAVDRLNFRPGSDVRGCSAFITGEFQGPGLTDDLEGLNPEQLDGVLGWRSFYRSDYIPVGVLVGSVQSPCPTPNDCALHPGCARV